MVGPTLTVPPSTSNRPTRFKSAAAFTVAILNVPPLAERHVVLGIVKAPVERFIEAIFVNLNVPFCRLRPPVPI